MAGSKKPFYIGKQYGQGYKGGSSIWNLHNSFYDLVTSHTHTHTHPSICFMTFLLPLLYCKHLKAWVCRLHFSGSAPSQKHLKMPYITLHKLVGWSTSCNQLVWALLGKTRQEGKRTHQPQLRTCPSSGTSWHATSFLSLFSPAVLTGWAAFSTSTLRSLKRVTESYLSSTEHLKVKTPQIDRWYMDDRW